MTNTFVGTGLDAQAYARKGHVADALKHGRLEEGNDPSCDFAE
jgi:hypothetical protein